MSSDPVTPHAADVTTALYKAAIGDPSQASYLRLFARFDQHPGVRPSWNWPAFLSTFNWFVFRKLWRWALGYVLALLGLALAVFGVGKLVFDYSADTALLAFGLLLLALSMLPALYGNAVFYRACIKQIEKAVASSASIPDACALLARQASSRRRWFVLALLNALFLGFVGSLFTLVPAFLEGEQTQVFASRARPEPADIPHIAGPADSTASAAQPAASAPAPSASAATPAASAPVAPASGPEPAASAPVVQPGVATEPPAVGPVAPSRAPSPAAKPTPAEQAHAGEAAGPAIQPARIPPAAPDASRQAHATPLKPDVNRPNRRFFIQVGAFADEANVRKVQTRLEAAGLSSFAQPIETSQGRLIRVKVGPFDRRVEANEVAVKIQLLDLPALLVRL